MATSFVSSMISGATYKRTTHRAKLLTVLRSSGASESRATRKLAVEPQLDYLITAIHGREDRSAQQELIEGGRRQSAAEFSSAEFAGEPFFRNTARTEVLAPVRRTLVG